MAQLTKNEAITTVDLIFSELKEFSKKGILDLFRQTMPQLTSTYLLKLLSKSNTLIATHCLKGSCFAQ